MTSTINASTSSGVVTSADNSGVLQLQGNGTAGISVNTSGAVGVGSSPSYGTSGYYLQSAGSSSPPTWALVSLTAGVTGTLPIANGGTGSTSTTYCNLSTNVTSTLPIANGGTGATTLAGANIPVTNSSNTFTAAQTFRAASAIRSEAASTQDAIVVAGRAGGTSSYALTFTPDTLSASRTVTFPDGGGNYTVGYRNVPAVGTKTGSYTLATTDVGKYVQLGSGGSITIPDATFAEGDIVTIFNNTTGAITITCTITTAYIAGTDSDKATVSLATRGVATIFFISSTVCVITGNVT